MSDVGGTIEITYCGETYRGAYVVKKGMVQLLTNVGTIPPKGLAGNPAKDVARSMLKEILHRTKRH